MSFGLTNAPMIYQRMMDNALWGLVQPKGGWKAYSERMQSAEEDVEARHRLLQRLTECRISVSFTKSIFVQSRVNFHLHDRGDAKKFKRVTEFSFPTTKKGIRFIQDFTVYATALHQLKDEDFDPGGGLSVARQSFAKLQQKQKEVHVTLFANEWTLSSILVQEYDGKMHTVRFCGRVQKEAAMNYHPAEKEILALLLLLKAYYTQLSGRTIHVHT
ncbi:hypothetical protein PHMEG_0006597 [Phytophthora megakarya]|uniref:Reverse transcriptase RNase H-like domain-containing protein n=1 Tax=Phytophthora megakarya TaxID=4795 RepID=A0A225WNH9_9STRA|nr:hypothetical protein PHMEG_0006597 [Phytophthora megakarya]